jgi:hypothetical protein
MFANDTKAPSNQKEPVSLSLKNKHNRLYQQTKRIKNLKYNPDRHKASKVLYKVYENDLKESTNIVHQKLLEDPDYKATEQRIINIRDNINQNLLNNPDYKDLEQRIKKTKCPWWNPRCWRQSKEERAMREVERQKLEELQEQLKLLKQEQNKKRILLEGLIKEQHAKRLKYNSKRYSKEKKERQAEKSKTIQSLHTPVNRKMATNEVQTEKYQEAIRKLKNNTAKKPGILKGTEAYKTRKAEALKKQGANAQKTQEEQKEQGANAQKTQEEQKEQEANAQKTQKEKEENARKKRYEEAKQQWRARNRAAALAPKNTAKNVIANKTPESGQESMTTA